MASGFPASIDNFTDPLSNSPLNSPSHSAQHADLNDAVEKIETYMGLVKVIPTSATNGTVSSTGTVTVGTAVSSVTVSGCFSSTYDAYEIVYTNGISSNTDVLYLTLSGNTGANYYSAGAQNTSGSATYNGIGNAATTRFYLSTCTAQGFGLTWTVHNAFLAKQTFGRCNFVSDYSSGWTGHVNNNPISSTGFTFLPGAGTLTGGTIIVYGYRK
jgi:hypothetical protein